MSDPRSPRYLRPYQDAARTHGGGFRTLLWASRQSQAARFDALIRGYDFAGRRILDAGCGHADLMDYLLERNIRPAEYIGLEAMATLAATAREKNHAIARIVECDFVIEPQRLCTASDVIVFCGSLNTLDETQFYASLRTAITATVDAVAFNFLSSPTLAAAQWLRWYRPQTIVTFVEGLGASCEPVDTYMEGDCTMIVRRHG